jgi:hypothetical protein
MRIPTTLLIAAAISTLAVGPASAGKPAKPVNVKLECKIVFAPGAEGAVRYEVNGGRKRFQAVVEVEVGEEAEDGNEAMLAEVPLYAEGDHLPVSIGAAPGYPVGAMTLERDADQLEGALKLESRGRGGAVLPSDFPALAAGTLVTIDGQSCSLKQRGRRGR